MTDKAYAVPLHELLAGVPRNTRLEITDPDGYGTRFIPVGRYCHEAAEALRAALAQPVSELVALEREACAKVCDDLPVPPYVPDNDAHIWDVTCVDCAAAIRARGQQ